LGTLSNRNCKTFGDVEASSPCPFQADRLTLTERQKDSR
jgi:hypothetical protein